MLLSGCGFGRFWRAAEVDGGRPDQHRDHRDEGEHFAHRTGHIEELTVVQRATTLVPTVPMITMAVTMIRPSTSAYSITSPPRSSAHSREISPRIVVSSL